MATVIDSLIVKLGLDSRDFQRGEREVASGLDKTRKTTAKVGKDISASGKQAAEFFGQMERAAVKFFAVITVGRGLSDFTRTIVQGGAQLDRMSQNLGVSADRLSRWQGAVRQSGGTADAFLGTMQGLSASLTELKLTGNTGILPYLQALGVSVADTNGKAKPLDELLADIGEKLNALPNREDAFNIGRNLGIDEGTINLLLKGRSEVERLLAAQKGYSDADAKAAREAAEQWELAKLRIERASQALVISLLPVMERLVETTAEFVETITPGLEMVTEGFAELDEATDGWASSLAAALVVLRIIGGPGVLSGITKLGGALGAVISSALLLRGDTSESTKQAQELYNRSIAGDRNAALALAEIQLANQWWRGAATEQEIQERANEIMLGGHGSGAPSGPGAPAPLPFTGSSRAQRNFNPGNLEFRGQAGAVPEAGSGRFAKFGSAAEGVSALVKQLQRYDARGLDTLDEIINTYAPSSENNTQAYIAQLSKALGVTGSQELDLNNPEVLSRLVKGISRHESGSDWLTNADVMSGLEMAGVSTSSTSNMTIGEVKVYTQASDANGIARDIRGALIRQADTGMR